VAPGPLCPGAFVIQTGKEATTAGAVATTGGFTGVA
jgi:hypothetical protein